MSKQNRPLVLCAEDNTDSSELMTRFLDGAGYDVQLVTTCAETLEFAGQRKFALYILDSRLKDGTSAELCRKIRLQDGRTPILMYSGDGYEAQITVAMAAGANDYVVKPDWNKLLQVVQKLTAR